MSLHPKRREELLAHCGELRDDDCVDPREYFRPTASSGRKRKTRQLCSQVAQALAQILASEFDDDLLLGLKVLTVEPAPNESQLLVMLQTEQPDPAACEETLRRLNQVAGVLRSEVASAITRKRVPQLLFRLVCESGQPTSAGVCWRRDEADLDDRHWRLRSTLATSRHHSAL